VGRCGTGGSELLKRSNRPSPAIETESYMTHVPARINTIADDGRLQLAQKEDTIFCTIDPATDYKAMPIQELLEHYLRTGDDAAAKELVERIRPTIQGVVYKSLRRHSINYGPIQELIRDLTSDTFVKLWPALPRFEWQGEGRFFGWVKKITINVVEDWHRRQKIEEPEEEALNTPEQGVSCAERIQLNQFEEWLNGMGEAQQNIDIFWFYYRYGYTAKEIGNMPEIDMTEKRVETILARMVRQLRRKMGKGSSGE
jgi:RNA polymerase sigma-70 factor, ECF subfamily